MAIIAISGDPRKGLSFRKFLDRADKRVVLWIFEMWFAGNGENQDNRRMRWTPIDNFKTIQGRNDSAD